jgi:hypothetical protein
MEPTKGSPDGQEPSALEKLRKVREGLTQRSTSQTVQRPEEDRIREEHHDAQAKTIHGEAFGEWDAHQQRPKRKPASRKSAKSPSST